MTKFRSDSNDYKRTDNSSGKWGRLKKWFIIGIVAILVFAILILGILLVNDLNLTSGIIIIIMIVFWIALWKETE